MKASVTDALKSGVAKGWARRVSLASQWMFISNSYFAFINCCITQDRVARKLAAYHYFRERKEGSRKERKGCKEPVEIQQLRTRVWGVEGKDSDPHSAPHGALLPCGRVSVVSPPCFPVEKNEIGPCSSLQSRIPGSWPVLPRSLASLQSWLASVFPLPRWRHRGGYTDWPRSPSRPTAEPARTPKSPESCCEPSCLFLLAVSVLDTHHSLKSK